MAGITFAFSFTIIPVTAVRTQIMATLIQKFLHVCYVFRFIMMTIFGFADFGSM